MKGTPMPDERDGPTPDLVTFVDEVERYWSDHGMRSTDRRRLTAELERDLSEALRNGASADELVRDDVGHFAASVASANAIDLVEPAEPEALTVRALVRTGLVGGLGGALLAWIFIYNSGAASSLVDAMPELAAVWILHVCAAGITIAGMVTAMRWRFKHDPRISRVVAAAALLIVLAGIVSVGPIMLVAVATDYSTAPIVLLVEVGIAAAFCGAAIAAVARKRLPPE